LVPGEWFGVRISVGRECVGEVVEEGVELEGLGVREFGGDASGGGFTGAGFAAEAVAGAGSVVKRPRFSAAPMRVAALG
jgi:hypothetical protein